MLIYHLYFIINITLFSHLTQVYLSSFEYEIIFNFID